MSAVLRVEDDTPGLLGASPYAYGDSPAPGAVPPGPAATGPQFVVVAKGAPEVIKGLLGEWVCVCLRRMIGGVCGCVCLWEGVLGCGCGRLAVGWLGERLGDTRL